MASRSTEALVGRVIAERYRLTRKVGEGGMGEVYEAVNDTDGEVVAVKILRDKYTDRPEVARRLLNEAQLASSIAHDHIVRILESGTTDDGRPFVVMEHLSGESLAERIRREGAQDQQLVVRIALQAAGALGAAHARSVLHRDVKPENLIVLHGDEIERAQVKIVDFGISKHMAGESSDSDLRLTATGMVLGTPLYMAPEQARGSDDLDHRVDVYSLGVIMYEALTGEVPFRANNYLGVISQVLSAEVVPPRVLRPELSISPALNTVVLRAMQRDLAQRYPSMEVLAADLERIAAGKPLSDSPSVSLPAMEPRRGRALWPLGIGLGLGAVALLTVPRLGSHETLPTVVVPSNAEVRPRATPVDAAVPIAVSPTPAEPDPEPVSSKHAKKDAPRTPRSRPERPAEPKGPTGAETLPNPY
jgi:serine/threonine-protein kinase